jgi:Aspartyl protease
MVQENRDTSTQNIMNWRKANKSLLYLYPGEWIAFNPQNGILAHHTSRKELRNMLTEAGFNSTDYVCEYIHPYEVPLSPYRILPIRIRSVKKHDWEPKYKIRLQVGDQIIEEMMLIDSGADISVITRQCGKDLGLSFSDSDPVDQAGGVGGGIINFIRKMINIQIDGYSCNTPVAWVVDEHISEMIIGREIIFDQFDIEFKQADEEIIFKKRNVQVNA